MKNTKKNVNNVFIAGTVFGISLCLIYMFLTGNLPFLKAAGVGTGAPDINAKYLDGYGTATTSTSSKVYISDASGYLPDSSVDTGAIVNGTIDIANDVDLTTDGAGSGLDADLLDGMSSTSFIGNTCRVVTDTCTGSGCTATCTCDSDEVPLAVCGDLSASICSAYGQDECPISDDVHYTSIREVEVEAGVYDWNDEACCRATCCTIK